MKPLCCILFFIFITHFISGCTVCTVKEEVTFKELLANPRCYNGENIAIEGYLFIFFEGVYVSEDYVSKNRTIIAEGESIWFDFFSSNFTFSEELKDRLYKDNYGKSYGKVRIKGVFEYGAPNGYGHLNTWDSQIIPSEVEVLSWSPLSSQ